MRLLTLCALQARKAEGAGGLVDDADRCFLNEISKTRNAFQLTETEATRPRRLLRGRDKNINNLKQLSENLGIPVDLIFNKLIGYSRRSLENADCLTGNRERLETMPVERFNQLQIAVLAFQETDVYDIGFYAKYPGRNFNLVGYSSDFLCLLCPYPASCKVRKFLPTHNSHQPTQLHPSTFILQPHLLSQQVYSQFLQRLHSAPAARQ